MLLRDAKPKVISEALGHASVAFTMDVYSHIIEGMQSDAMALLDEVLPAPKNGVPHKINTNLTPACSIMLSTNWNIDLGGVTEWLMVAVLKTAFAFLANVGSNPTPSAI
jgi:hypothetical protein